MIHVQGKTGNAVALVAGSVVVLTDSKSVNQWLPLFDQTGSTNQRGPAATERMYPHMYTAHT